MDNKQYTRLGDYIQEVNVRNNDLSITRLLGVNLSKKFIPSVANIIGTDLSKYKVIKKGQFGCKLMSVERDGILPISLMKEDEPAIISSAYYVFEVKDVNVLLPEYLMMYFSYPEFDRRLRLSTGGDVRGGLNFDDFCNMLIFKPDIEEQRRIVSEYQTIEKRIENNVRLIDTLQRTARALHYRVFEDNIDPDNLPSGWRLGTIKDVCAKMTSGGTPNTSIREYWSKKDYPWLKSGEVHNNVVCETEDYISEAGYHNSSAKLMPVGTITMAMYGVTAAEITYLDCETTTNQACCNMICHSRETAAYLYFHLLADQSNIKRLANGGAQDNLSLTLISQQKIIIHDREDINKEFLSILDEIIISYRENNKLNKIKNVILTKLS